nr:MAG TPA: putative tail fiber protein [Caudoviricetes sp.]
MKVITANLLNRFWTNGVKPIKTAVGTISSLTTTAKTNLVAAINEVKAKADSNTDDITTLNNNLVGRAVNSGSVTDLAPGRYYCGGNVAGMPYSAWFYVEHITLSPTESLLIAWPVMNKSNIYRRLYTGGTWQDWVDTGSVSTYTGTINRGDSPLTISRSTLTKSGSTVSLCVFASMETTTSTANRQALNIPAAYRPTKDLDIMVTGLGALPTVTRAYFSVSDGNVTIIGPNLISGLNVMISAMWHTTA